MIDQVAEKVVRRVILGFLLGGLLLLSYAVLHLFIVPVAWAVIIAYATWTPYRQLRSRLPRYPTISALLMTLLLSAAFVLPALWIGMLLRTEVGVAIAAVTAQIREGAFVLPEFVRTLPWIGDDLQAMVGELTREPEALRAQLTEWVRQGSDLALTLIGDVGRNARQARLSHSSPCSSSTATASACSSRWWRCCAASSASASTPISPRWAG
jgi:predicted PurR-regulated permease PerM